MVRPEDLEKLFGQNPPDWVKKETAEEKKTEPTERKVEQEETVISVVGMVGVIGSERMYAFYRHMGPTVEREEDGYAVHAADDMIPLGKHPHITSQFAQRRLWNIQGILPPGMYVKIFVGHEGRPGYGIGHFVTDPQTAMRTIKHPEERNLYISARLHPLTDEDLQQYGIPIQNSTRNLNMTLTVEVQND